MFSFTVGGAGGAYTAAVVGVPGVTHVTQWPAEIAEYVRLLWTATGRSWMAAVPRPLASPALFPQQYASPATDNAQVLPGSPHETEAQVMFDTIATGVGPVVGIE